MCVLLLREKEAVPAMARNKIEAGENIGIKNASHLDQLYYN
jgi:hypothetical protein